MSTLSIKSSSNVLSPIGLVAIAAVLACVATFSSALLGLVDRWSAQEEYSHGFLIPVVAAWLLWTRRDALRASIGRPSLAGPCLILLAIVHACSR